LADQRFDIGVCKNRTLRRSLTRLALVLMSGLLLGAPAPAAELLQVRVGKHPTFTRVVFELDVASGYRIERHAEGEEANTILVTLDAGSRARNIASTSPGVATVTVDADNDRAIARIVARESGWPIKEMMLADPPRIVLDLMLPGTDLLNSAKAPAPKPTGSALTEPEPVKLAVEPIAEPTPEAIEQPVIASPATAPSGVPAAEPVTPAELAEAPIAPPPEPILDEPPADETTAEVVPLEEVEGEQATAPAEPLVEISESVTEITESEALAETAPAEAEEAVAEEWLDLAEVPPIVAELPESVPTPVEPIRVAEPAAKPVGEPNSAPFEVGAGGMIAGGVLALVLGVFLVARRRRAQPEGMDVTAMAEAGDPADEATDEVRESTDEATDEERIPQGGFSMASPADEELPPETIEPSGTSPLSETESVTTPSNSIPGAAPGIFDEELEEKQAMDMDNQDLPITHNDPEAPTQIGIGAAAIGGAEPDVARMFQEFERRIAHVEARLDEAVEARDKLERQVSAQNEELRVQRAAIARTQRALRSLNRSEEDQATEPALRDQPKPNSAE